MAVMGVKVGTNFIGNTSDNVKLSGDSNNNNISANDKAKLGEENIGDVLNKIVDPNWVDPSKKIRAVGNDKMDKDAFMKMMMAQMKNQDPTNPLKSHELAAQLAQFSSVEQMQNINSNLQDIKQGQKPIESFQALNFIGKSVAGDSSKIQRNKGDKFHDFSFQLGQPAKEMNLRIRNSMGEIVRSVNLKDLKQGANEWTWNGQDDRGNSLPVGDYTIFSEAKDLQGKKIAVQSSFEGLITGVNYTPEGPVLLVGNQSVKLRDVKKIIDPSLMKNDQNKAGSSNPQLNNGTQQVENKNMNLELESSNNQIKGAEEIEPQGANMLDTVKMSRDMINSLSESQQKQEVAKN